MNKIVKHAIFFRNGLYQLSHIAYITVIIFDVPITCSRSSFKQKFKSGIKKCKKMFEYDNGFYKNY